MTTEETVIAALVTAGLDVHTGRVPTDVPFPYVIVNKISHPVLTRSHQGNEMERPRYQIDVWAETYESSVETGEIVKGVLDINTTDFKMSTKETEIDVPEVEPGLYHRVIDFFIYV